MLKINQYDIELLKNLNEQRAWEIFPIFLDHNPDVCTCSSCVLDIMAITLNNLPPCYQTNEPNVNDARKKVSDEEIYRQMKLASITVKARPRHQR